jgi:hypothetical protein
MTNTMAQAGTVMEGEEEKTRQGFRRDLMVSFLEEDWEWPETETETLLPRLPSPGMGETMTLKIWLLIEYITTLLHSLANIIRPRYSVDNCACATAFLLPAKPKRPRGRSLDRVPPLSSSKLGPLIFVFGFVASQ